MSKFEHNDQAAGLRRIMAAPKPRIVTLLSAATTPDQPRLMTNLAATIRRQGGEVLIVHASTDSDEARYDIEHLPALLDVAHGQASLLNAIDNSGHGFYVAKLQQKQHADLEHSPHISIDLNKIFNELARQYEIVLVDATLNKAHLLPIDTLHQHEIIIQLTRQPESIKHAYTLIKQICSQLGRRSFGIIVDNASEAQAQIVFRNIAQVAERFMQIELEFFGAIPADDDLSRAAKLGRSIIDAFPLAGASTAFKQIAQRLSYHNDSYHHELAQQRTAANQRQVSFI
jgi:flagellar biosynthesis protein FlhG